MAANDGVESLKFHTKVGGRLVQSDFTAGVDYKEQQQETEDEEEQDYASTDEEIEEESQDDREDQEEISDLAGVLQEEAQEEEEEEEDMQPNIQEERYGINEVSDVSVAQKSQ